LSAVEPDAAKPLPLGVAYLGTGDPALACAVIQEALSGAGMASEVREAGPDVYRLQAVQRAPWHRVLIEARPQRAVWHVERQGERLLLASDFRLFPWYSVLVGLLWLAVIAGFHGSLVAGRSLAGPARSVVGGGLLLAAVVLIPLVLHLLGALGTRAEPLWHEILFQLEKKGGRFDPQGKGLMVRHTAALAAFLGSVLVLAGRFLVESCSGSAFPFPRGASALAGALGMLLVLLVVTLAFLFGRRGFGLRTPAVLTGLLSMASMLLFLLGPVLPWWMVSRVDLAALGPRLGLFGRLVAGVGIVILGAFAYILVRLALHGSILLRPGIQRLGSGRAGGSYRLAVGAASPLPFQSVFFLTWALLGGLILAVLVHVVLCGVQAVAPVWTSPELRLPEISGTLLAAALGRSPSDPDVLAWVRAGWVAFAATGVALLAVSTGQLVLSRRAGRKQLAKCATRSFDGRDALERKVGELCRGVRLALGPDREPGAQSFRFGLRGERFIEISEGCLRLPPGELHAMLCHECAHHLLGHTAKDNLLRWLARFSFAGDGFARAVQDSFGYEKEADRFAVRVLGVSREDLLARLEQSAEAAPNRRPFTSFGGSQGERWRWALRLFWKQYRGDDLRHYYWHPSMEDRRTALLSL
jgi:Zn-dependent protease with chaperone function